MTNETKPKIENLDQQEEELTPEQAEVAQGGVITGSIQPFSHEIVSPRDPASGLPTGK